MKLLKRIFTALLILLIMNLYLPKLTFAEQYYLYSKADITKHKPEILSKPEKDIPAIKKKGSSWGWYILLLLVAWGAAEAADGGGEEETQTSPTQPSNGDTGDVTVTW
jgi:hypothetical protein